MVLSEVNKTITDAVIKKCEKEFPGVLDLISVHGSVLTGDTHKGSDLDLNIVINGPCSDIASCFILEDTGIGYDLYCTSWDRLEEMADCPHPHLAKLMDGKIIYSRNKDAENRYLSIRRKAAERLAAPFGSEDMKTAEKHIAILKDSFYSALTSADMADIRNSAVWVIQEAIEAVMTLNKKYFRLGVKRTFEELNGLDLPEAFTESIIDIIKETDGAHLKTKLTDFAGRLNTFFDKYRDIVSAPKDEPSAANLTGTYEEMISNWHKKVREAAGHNDPYSAFMAIASMNYMRNNEIGSEVNIRYENVMECFDPKDLHKTFADFETALDNYKREYEKAGIKVKSYKDADSFAADYLGEINS